MRSAVLFFIKGLAISLVLFTFLQSTVHCSQSIEIRLWEYPRWTEAKDTFDRFAWIKRKILEFEKDNPNISVKLTELTWERGDEKKSISEMLGVGPDVSTGKLPIESIERGGVENIDDYLTEEDLKDYTPSALSAYRWNGKIWGWPWLLTGNCLFINLDIFRERGVMPPNDGMWSNDEFVKKMKALTFDRDDDGKIDVYGFGFYVGGGEIACIFPFLYSDGAEILSSDMSGFTLDSGAGVGGLQKLFDLVHKFSVSPRDSGGMLSKDVWEAFKHGMLAVSPWGIWAIPKLVPGVEERLKIGFRPTDYFDFDLVHFPYGKTGKPVTFIATTGFIVHKQKSPSKKTACMKLARFLTSGESQKALVNYGCFPTRKSTGDLYPDNPYMQKAKKILENGITLPPHPKWEKIDEKLSTQIQLALLDEKTVQTALSDGRKEIEPILKEKDESPTTKTKPWLAVAILTIFGAGIFLLLRGKFSLKLARKHRTAYLFILPSMVLFFVFLIIPVLISLSLAFQKYEPFSNFLWGKFVGLSNFKNIFQDPVFRRAIGNTILYTFVRVPFNLTCALILATLIHPLSKTLQSFFRAAYYLPGVVSMVVISMVWRWMFDVNFGFLNTALSGMGGHTIGWLTDPKVAFFSIILTSILQTPGPAILIYLAAMSSIPSFLYEAGEIDGAGGYQKWRYITLPLLTPTTLFLLVTTTVISFQVFAQVLILTNGGPGYSTTVVVHQIYNSAFRDFEFGRASAMALLLFLTISFVSVFQFKILKGEYEY